MKRFLILLCILLLLAGTAAAENVLRFPEELTVIAEEAFMNAASVRRVVLPDGAKEIHNRAFAGSSVRAMNLPESLEYIAENAFDDCEKLTFTVPRDSYAHRYASDHDLRYTIIEPQTDVDDEDAGYAIHHVECVTEIIPNLPKPHRYFRVDADMAERCGIEVRFYDEEDPDGELLQYYYEEVFEEEMNGDDILVILPYEAVFPEYFILDVRLIRERDGKQMGEPYITCEYTKRRAEIADKPQEDYAEQEVVSYGDAGYAVFSEGVIRTEGAKVSGGYVLTPPRELKKGDVLYLDLGDRNAAVKVQSVKENGDGTVTVTPDDDICLADVFEHLDISGYMQPASGLISPADPAADATFIPMSPSYKMGPVTVGGTAGVSVKMDIKHDKEADYFSAECWIESIADLEIKLTGAVNSRDWEKNPFEIPLCPPMGLKIPETDIEALLTVTIPLNFEVEAGGSAFVNVRSKTGFSYNSDDKQFNKIKEKEAKAYAEVVGKVSLDAGPQVKIEAELLELLDAKIWGQIGVKATGELEGLHYGGSVSDSQENPASKHACLGCLNCDINLIAGVYGKLEGGISEKIKLDFLDEPIFEISKKVGDAYWSFLNEAESIYGEEPSFGFTECGNHRYRTELTTLDYQENSVTGIPVVCTGEKGSANSGKSPYSLYLYPGNYTAQAAFKLGDVSQSFAVKNKARSVAIKEKAVSITGDVRDVDTYETIPGAQVTLTLPDGSSLSQTADALGEFAFDGLPAGVYSITASAQEYEPYTYDSKECTQGGSYGVHITLVKGRISIEGVVSDGDTGKIIGGATVIVRLPDGSERSTTADAQGRYRFEDLPAGVYAVTAQAEGYLSKTYSDLTYKGNSENTLNLALNMDWPDAKIVKQLVESMSGDLISRMKAANIGVSPSFTYYKDASGGNVLSYTLRWDMDYSKYDANEELFKEALIAIIDSGIFPLTEEEAADIKSRIRRSVTYGFEVDLSSGFSTWGGVPGNSLIVELNYDPRSSGKSYTRQWGSRWNWDELNSRTMY